MQGRNLTDAAPREEPGIPRTLKTPPHSAEAEQAVLGGLMLNNEAWDDVADRIASRDFYWPKHRFIFEAMALLAGENQPLDALTLSDALQSRGQLDRAGGPAYLGELAESTPGASNVPAYARIVQERSILRQLIGAAQVMADDAYQPDGRTGEQLLDAGMQRLQDIDEGRMRGDGPQPIKPLADRALDRMKALYGSKNAITGLATGFEDLNKLTAGLQPSDLIIVAGRPAMGKTSLAMNMVEHAVMDSDTPTLVFSLEMSADQLALRMLSSLGRIDQSRMRTGELSDEDWQRFIGAVSQIKSKPLFIDDTAALSANEIRSRARRVKRSAGLGLIVVDYLQLMRGSEQRPESRTSEISEISRSLKAIARDFRCPLVAISQLNRALETRQNKRPMMADLRESGAIEQDADLILFIYRDELYDPESADKGTAEIIIGKQRNGPTGMVKLSFLNHLTKFENLAPDRYEDIGPEAIGPP